MLEACSAGLPVTGCWGTLLLRDVLLGASTYNNVTLPAYAVTCRHERLELCAFAAECNANQFTSDVTTPFMPVAMVEEAANITVRHVQIASTTNLSHLHLAYTIFRLGECIAATLAQLLHCCHLCLRSHSARQPLQA